MFNFVHHVRILVHNADDMVTYMEQTFNMTPVKVQVYESRGMKNAIYKVGETNLEFTEPLDANSGMGKFLEREGPGVYHIAFGVDGIEEVAEGLVANGHTLSGKNGTVRSAEGYLTATLAPESALGFPFQVAEGEINEG
jgi:methylmalonyl-CoA/ethylmalonyl-CoA epimerase